MSYNKDELVGPAWLNDKFFRGVMREANKDTSIELTSECVLRPGTKVGEHYGSVMFRTTVSYRSKKCHGVQTINLIMKITPEADGLKKDLLGDNALFDIETRVYSKVLPEMARLLKEIGEDYKYPKFIYGALKPHTIIIMEDISHKGWVMGGFIKTLDDMKPIVRNIAMFHAASVMMESKNSNIASEYNYSIVEKMMSIDTMIKKGFSDLTHLTRTCPEFSHLAAPLENFQRDLRKILDGLYTASNTIQNVLIHGDFQFKNMLHQIDAEGHHTDTILLDYQICSWTSPAVDLYYLLDLIPTQEIKDKHRHELIYLYHQQYSSLLRRMGFLGKIPTLLDLQMELLRCSGLEMFHYVVFSSFRYLDQATLDIEAFVSGKAENPVLNSPSFKKLMNSELNRLLHQGTLYDV